MKKRFLALMALVTLGAQAQDYNKWLVDVNAGVNKPLLERVNYFTATPSLWTVDGGVRYMFNNKVGVRLGGGYDSYKNAENSKTFDSNLWNVNLQGYVNAARLLNFESWTSDLGLLLHAGVGYGELRGVNLAQQPDRVGFTVAGLSPQLRITDRITFFGDASIYLNVKQNKTFDTYFTTNTTNGVKFNFTLGLSFALGHNAKSADWYYEASKIEMIEEKISSLEERVNAIDKDVKSLAVIDSNLNGVPDNVEAFLQDNYAGKGDLNAISSDAAKSLVENGYISVYFDFNSSKPQASSIWASDFIVKYLKSNPDSSVVALGFADELGNEAYNQRLSEKRANAVRDLLIKAGVDANRVVADGKGEDNSVDKNSSNARQIARRVTFKLK